MGLSYIEIDHVHPTLEKQCLIGRGRFCMGDQESITSKASGKSRREVLADMMADMSDTSLSNTSSQYNISKHNSIPHWLRDIDNNSKHDQHE